ncbi:FlaA1/EpsC-like NDP-sugar epimerase [Clostridium acetobutylicum]|uniref:Predicted nucleoside-diphosphate sugar epimerase n=1 Tax=Clostridium acetobutylicum (strain ATCC 824 / DSM 792 / JCM 1419 / IAM 19013 / LMG 5710 / NBRC 13948 / NRRL B-527 / VKM B-1787 / 2291 / W) TaxID=272562 RepID=Q97H20_CLOAB|nr:MULTISPECIES: SDR family NAD(P)-dependent oxidoreductase [Clostridium]AAK80151.1 Predicted nucleoside-diphosphate sugar epimerase [Clostridium acetobutylicum ATCC 824]ADZ21245.1 nucleoside-diphosphate sugar epimerase [Clostridium acetobutylicum EA 2018]AEI32223.1 nucleoside-diphosphate sugar epimerase [Clostridium acetobutylicum DSM 1731]AWV79423.1 polysaccharide biosynthesis protein [Clostridium acetobutylicum]KHD38337.1 membrane protein [Clostridium acetobutylicum]
MGYFTGKNVLIVGGTGTIGHGLINELLKENPKVIRIFSRDEYKQFLMQNEFRGIAEKFRFLIGDVRDYDRVERAMNGIDVVFNLAAMKHVPACEYNPEEAIRTNITGMENVIKAATYHNVECVVFTSSDKAINPTNSYGATKLLAEKLVQAANYSKGNVRTKFVAVRFGNVMGSRGSVIPLFKKQIEENAVITVTDPTMSRFMMTLSQAVKLIMTAAKEATGGEVFILKMPVIKLIDLAKVVVEETSRKLDINPERIKIKEIGLRAGERCYEELMTREESVNAYDLGHSYVVIPSSFYITDYKSKYSKYKKAEIGSYNSSSIEPITLDEVRQLLKNCGLL